jgi:hypothetical protein
LLRRGDEVLSPDGFHGCLRSVVFNGFVRHGLGELDCQLCFDGWLLH